MLTQFPETVLITIVISIAIVVLLVPVMLRLAGLTGQQIADTISLTLNFFVNIVKEFRAVNKLQ